MLQNLDHYVNADVGREATTGVVHIRERNVLHRLIVPLTFEGADIDLDGASVTFVYQLPSGTQSTAGPLTVTDGCAIVPLGLTVVTTPGEVQCQLEAYKNSSKVFSTPIIRLEIAEDLYDSEAQEELEDLPTVYEQIVSDYEDWKDYIDDLKAAVENGDFNGQDGADGEKGDKGEKGDPGTTDYNELINKPTIPTVPEIVLSTNYNGDGNMNTDEKIISSKAVKAFVEGKQYITNSALSGYVQSSSLAAVATSGSYADLSNKPTIPTVPDLSKSSTVTQDISSDTKTVTPKAMKTWVDAQSFAASSDIPTVPTNVSSFTNDAGYLTEHQSLAGYALSSSLATVATTGDYDDLTDKPTIPTKTSDLTNDAGFLTEHQSLSGYVQSSSLAAVATSGSYSDLSNKPTIPTVPDLSKSSTVTQDLSSDTKTVTPKAMKTWVDTQTAEVMQVANGKCACYVFDEKEDLDEWLEVAANVANLHTGDVFLIRDTDVPDYWWDGSTSPGTTQVLETTKVDLDDYVQSTDLAAVATSGSYADLSNKPSLATVATSGSYADLSNKPTIPTVPDLSKSSTISSDISSDTKTVTPKAMKTWVEGKGYLTSHQSLSGYLQTGDNVSSLTNDAGYLTQHQSLTNYATKTYVDNAVAGITPGGGSGCMVYEIPIGSMMEYDSRIDPPLYGLEETMPVTSEISSMFNDLTTTEEAIAYELDDGTYIPLTVGTSSGITYLYNNADSDGDAVDNSKPSVWCSVEDGVFGILTNEDRSNDTLRFRSGTPYVHVGDNVSELVNDAGYQTATDVSTRVANYVAAQHLIYENDNISYLNNDAGYLTSHQSLSGYAKYALESPLVASGGDGANVGKIALDQAHSGQITNNSTGTIFGFLSDNATDLTVGSTSYALKLRGSGTRPQFNGNNLALYSDVPTVPTNVSSFTNDSEYRKKYIITGSLNLSTLAITNLQHNGSACSFSDAQTAWSAGKRLELQLTYTSPFNVTQVGVGDLVVADSTFIQFVIILHANMGSGYASYILDAQWTSTGITATMVQLAESTDIPTVPTKVSDLTNDTGFITSSALPSNPLTLSDKSNYNCNTRYDGKVWLVGSGSNCPSGSQYGALFTLPYRQASGNSKPDYAGQIFIPNGDDATKPNSMFYRTSLENSWNAWKEVAVEGACNADKIDGYHVSVVSSLPASPDSNTIYIVT